MSECPECMGFYKHCNTCVAQRCAPLVEALEWIEKRYGFPPSFLSDKARAALAAYHAAQGAGRENARVVSVLRDPRFRLRVSAVDGWVTASIDNLTGDGENAFVAVLALAEVLDAPANFIDSGWR